MSSLKPCPFCNSEDVAVNSGFVRCNSCEAEGPYHEEMDESEEDSFDSIVEAWNTRASDATAERLVGLLRAVWDEWNKDANGSPTYGTMDNIKAALAAFDAERKSIPKADVAPDAGATSSELLGADHLPERKP